MGVRRLRGRRALTPSTATAALLNEATPGGPHYSQSLHRGLAIVGCLRPRRLTSIIKEYKRSTCGALLGFAERYAGAYASRQT